MSVCGHPRLIKKEKTKHGCDWQVTSGKQQLELSLKINVKKKTPKDLKGLPE